MAAQRACAIRTEVGEQDRGVAPIQDDDAAVRKLEDPGDLRELVGELSRRRTSHDGSSLLGVGCGDGTKQNQPQVNRGRSQTSLPEAGEAQEDAGA